MPSGTPPIGGKPMICIGISVRVSIGCMVPLYTGMLCCCVMPVCTMPSGDIGLPIGCPCTRTAQRHPRLLLLLRLAETEQLTCLCGLWLLS